MHRGLMVSFRASTSTIVSWTSRGSGRRYGNIVHHPTYAANVPHHLFRVALLEHPCHPAGERDVAVVHHCLHTVRCRAVQVEGLHDVRCDVRVGPFQRLTHLDVVGHGTDAPNSLTGPFCGQLDRTTVHIAGQCDRPTLGGDSHHARVDFGIPLQVLCDGIPQLDICLRQACSRHDILRRRCGPSQVRAAPD